ncbi:MAG: hypothetical protein H7A05_09850 [Pseudomonadales bacterium]|nr:hypothetical protein [Pseudomonadales bacterium]MCP5331236.1 hypothetical protein [Pseudomonadales bacterium]MCP5344913.1 hypothetical protein [Pseudomonadales bacterium]
MNIRNDFSRKSTQTLASLALVVAAWPSLVLAERNTEHEQAYRSALETVQQAPARIADAMAQVQSGEVAHYDFLQFEHIELVRHAQALAWPPGDFAAADKQALKQEAGALLDSANELEWIISDFLRAMAQARSASSNTLDIAAQQESNAAWQALEIQSLLFMSDAYQGDWSALAAAYDTVLGGDLSEQTRRELSFQKEQLARAVPQLQQQRDALAASDVAAHADTLDKLYQASL